MTKPTPKSYLTPFKCVEQIKRERFRKIPINRFDIYGSVYERNYFLRPESLRMLGGKWRHKDTASLHDHEVTNIFELDGTHQYLGHFFPSYGHFILETLPMLSYLMRDKETSGIFLAWDSASNRELLDNFLALLELDRSSILIHSSSQVLKAEMSIQPRPFRRSPCSPQPQYELTSYSAYRTVIEKLIHSAHANPSGNATKSQSRLFLMRDAKRLPTSGLQDSLKIELEAQGFQCIYPETLSLSDQVRSLSTAAVVAGFAGSQLHNSIFCPRDAIIIGIGDLRTPDHPNNFQKLCGEITENTYHQVKYSENSQKISSDIAYLLAQ